MAVNERLRTALMRSGYTSSALAEAVGVDAKTAERWVNTGRTPHRSHAHQAAKMLDEDVTYLWPAIEKGRRRGRGQPVDLVTVYSSRADAPFEAWRTMFETATKEIGVLAYAALFLHETWPGFVPLLRRKANTGCKVRVLLGDPDAETIVERGREEKYGHGIDTRCRNALEHYRPLFEVPGVEVHLHATTLYNSIYRGDDQMLVNGHLFGVNAYSAPVWQLLRKTEGGMFDAYADSFDAVWQNSCAARIEGVADGPR